MLIMILLAASLSADYRDSGYVTVRSDQPEIPVYLDGDYLGATPLLMHPVVPGEYTLAPVSSDSLESLYFRVRNAGLGAKLAALWPLARIDAATRRLNVRPGYAVSVELSRQDMDRAESRAKWLVYGSAGGLFLGGALLGLVIGLLAH